MWQKLKNIYQLGSKITHDYDRKLSIHVFLHHCTKILWNQTQVWQLYTDTSLLYTWKLSHIIPLWSKLPSTNQLASSCYLLYRRLEGSWSSMKLSWAMCHNGRSTAGKRCLCACFQTLSQSLKRIFIFLSSLVHREAWGQGSVIHWHPCRVEKSGWSS